MTTNDASLTSLHDLYNFENALNRYVTDLVQSTNSMTTAMNTINESWNDKIQEKFMENFVEALDGVKKMAELVDNHKSYVHKKAQQLELYVNSR